MRRRSKYAGMKVLLETISGSPQHCARCGRAVSPREVHFREQLTDSRVRFIGKRFCRDCHVSHGKGFGFQDRHG